MRILLVNKFYYNRGGDCTVALGIEELLRKHGHEVAFFAMNYPENFTSEWTPFFASEVSISTPGISSKLKAIRRILSGTGACKPFTKLLKEFHPDVVHLHNVHSYLSPVLARIAHGKGIKVVWTMHDYKLLCPSYSFLYQGHVCEVCLKQPFQVVRRRCMKGSLPASILAWLEARVWNKRKLSSWIDYFICPSHFMARKMIDGGYPTEKIKVLCNFLDSQKKEIIEATTENRTHHGTYCYVGRLSPEKGVEQLLKIASQLPYTLYIAGTGPLEESLKKQYASYANICFLGRIDSAGVIRLLKDVSFSVIPSSCYENNPLSVIESLCCGTPVLGARRGGIPELLAIDACSLFDVADEEDFKNGIIRMMEQSPMTNHEDLSRQSMEKYSGEYFYYHLLQLYV